MKSKDLKDLSILLICQMLEQFYVLSKVCYFLFSKMITLSVNEGSGNFSRKIFSLLELQRKASAPTFPKSSLAIAVFQYPPKHFFP